MTESTTPTAELSAVGVSIWLDDLSRERIASGGLQKLITDRNVVGVTTNPSIFQAALSKGTAYDAQVEELAERGADVDATIRTVTTDDVREASDVLRPQWEASDGIDGRVSIEVDPRLAHDADKTAAQAIAQVARGADDAAFDAEVDVFSLSVETDQPDVDAVAAFVARLVGAADTLALRGGEFVVGHGWLGLRGHPGPMASVSFGGLGIPDWMDDALQQVMSR